MTDTAPKWSGRRYLVAGILALLALQIGAIVTQRIKHPETRIEHVLANDDDAHAAAVANIAAQARSLGRQLTSIASSLEDAARTTSPEDVEAQQRALEDQFEANPWLIKLMHTTVPVGGEPPVQAGLLRTNRGLFPLGPVSAPSLMEYRRDTAWFHEAQFELDGNPEILGAWHEPQDLDRTGRQIIVYSAPLCSGSCAADVPVTAVLSAYVSLRELEQAVRNLDLGGSAEAFVVNRDGALVAHPRMDLVRRNTSGHELAWEARDAALGEAISELSVGHPANATTPRSDPATGRFGRLVWAPIRGGPDARDEGTDDATTRVGAVTHGLVGHVEIKRPVSETEMRHWLVMRIAGGVPMVMLMGLLLAVFLVPDPDHLAWIAATLASVSAGLLIAGLWFAADKHPSQPSPEDERILSVADLARFERNWVEATGDPTFIPTGMFLQSVEFQSANNVTIAGLAWQRLPVPPTTTCEQVLAAPPEDPGFVLPEADPGEELQVTLAYHRCDAAYGEELQGWRFRALLRQDFDYLLYPFDPQEIWVRLLPPEFDKNVVLVPDLIAYDRTARATLPGLDKELILPGWDLAGSGFAFRRRAYNTDFGIADYTGQSDFPELIYTVSLRRVFLGPFVGKIIPLGVAAAMLFCMLLLGTRRQKYEGAFGFTALEVVLGAAALFFVVIFDHSALRDDLATTKPFYLEYFYFVMYLALVGVCGNAILFAMGKGRIILFKDNLIPKIAFWPMALGAVAFVTTVIFW